jgi:acyl-CoA reductase-like NAD-dependent aldehyde dehydrogenase
VLGHLGGGWNSVAAPGRRSGPQAFFDVSSWAGKLFSGGWRRSDATANVVSPSTGEKFASSGVASPADVAEAAQLPAGIAHINDQTVDDESQAPFGGVGASGTGARFGGHEATIEAFTETQWVTVQGEIERYPF